MKKTAISLVLLFSTITCFAQESTEDKTLKQFYTEMGGAGIMFSANFDTRFSKLKQTGLGMRFGLGFTVKDNEEYLDENGNIQYRFRTIGTIPIGLNYVLGKETSPHMFEAGGGVTILTSKVEMLNYEGNKNKSNFMGFFSFMYRRQPVNGGFTWRIGFTPLINTAGDIVPFGGAGIGYSFK